MYQDIRLSVYITTRPFFTVTLMNGTTRFGQLVPASFTDCKTTFLHEIWKFFHQFHRIFNETSNSKVHEICSLTGISHLILIIRGYSFVPTIKKSKTSANFGGTLCCALWLRSDASCRSI